MKTRFSPWDTAEYLTTDEDIAAYLDACFEEGGSDAGFVTRALANVVRAKGIEAIAERAGLAPERLHALLSHDADPGFGEILQVIHALGMRLHAEKAA